MPRRVLSIGGRRRGNRHRMQRGTQMTKGGRNESAEARKERLAAELRANLQKRKAQARARRAGAEDRRDEGIAAADPKRDKAG